MLFENVLYSYTTQGVNKIPVPQEQVYFRGELESW